MDEEKAHTHRTPAAGAPDEPPAGTGHRDAARGDAGERDGLWLDGHARRGRTGPRTRPRARSGEQSD